MGEARKLAAKHSSAKRRAATLPSLFPPPPQRLLKFAMLKVVSLAVCAPTHSNLWRVSRLWGWQQMLAAGWAQMGADAMVGGLPAAGCMAIPTSAACPTHAVAGMDSGDGAGLDVCEAGLAAGGCAAVLAAGHARAAPAHPGSAGGHPGAGGLGDGRLGGGGACLVRHVDVHSGRALHPAAFSRQPCPCCHAGLPSAGCELDCRVHRQRHERGVAEVRRSPASSRK